MTAYVVKMDDPSQPKGATVAVDGIGLLTNGEDTIVDEEQADFFRLRHPDNATVIQAFEGSDVITAHVHKEDPPKDPPKPDPKSDPDKGKGGDKP